jgi:hypothetical protein
MLLLQPEVCGSLWLENEDAVAWSNASFFVCLLGGFQQQS